MASTSAKPSQHRVTARTILLTSTGSRAPLRLVTRICVRAVAGAVRLKDGCCGADAVAPRSVVFDDHGQSPVGFLARGERGMGHRRTDSSRSILPAAPPTRARQPFAALFERDHRGRSSDSRAPDLLRGLTYWASFPSSRELSASSPVVPDHRCGAVPESGRSRDLTGFPLRPTPWGRHRWRTQDIVFAGPVSTQTPAGRRLTIWRIAGVLPPVDGLFLTKRAKRECGAC